MEALQRLHNRGSVSTGYDIDNSCKFEDANDEYFTRTNASGTNRRTWTVSLWCKRTELSTADGLTMELWDGGVHSEATRLGFGLNNDELWYDIGYSTKFRGQTTRQYTDTAAWYHIVWKVDTTQATEADRMRLYVNGEEVTEWASRQYPTQNFDSAVHAGTLARLGSYDSSYHGFRGYIAEFNYLDGLAVAPTEFGETDEDTGIWKPKAYSGSYPGQSCYLDFSNSANLGSNAKGDDVDWTANNITAADQATDTPTNNFAVINTLQSNNSNLILSNGATSLIKSGNHGWQTTSANMAVRKGKWYAEFKLDTNATLIMLGVNQIEDDVAWNGSYIGAYSNSTARGMAYYSQTGYFYRNGGSGAIGNTYAAGDIIGIALCINDNLTGFMGMHRNGTWQNSQDPSAGTTNMLGLEYGNAIEEGIHYTFAISNHEGTGKVLANFGGFDGFTVSSGNADANGYGNFEYAVPTGYYALCTKNLEEFA